MSQKDPALPRYAYRTIAKARKRLLEDLLIEFYGVTPDETYLRALSGAFVSVMPDIVPQAVYESLLYLAGTELTPELIREVVFRLTGNRGRLRDGFSACPWSGQAALEWVPVQVMDYRYEQTIAKKPGSCYTLKVIAGTPCPGTISKFWGRGFCFMVARRLGYTATWRKYPLSHPAELVGLRLLVLLDPDLCKGQPAFNKIACTSALLKRNREIIMNRFRTSSNGPLPCPRGYNHRCVECFVGYDKCEIATHPTTQESHGNAASTSRTGQVL